MNLVQSFKQTVEEARSNPGFTSLYVGGVAFAVAFTMIFAILYYVRLAPIYPEYNRDTTMYIKNISVRHEATSSESMGTLGLPFVDEFISKLHNYEYMSVMSFTMATFVQPADGSGDFKALRNIVDPNFFKLYEYEFLAGRPFSEAEMDAGIKCAVISEDVANRLYGSPESAVGKDITFGYINFKIVGVVKPGTSMFDSSFAQIFSPYTAEDGYTRMSNQNNARRLLGRYMLAFKMKDDAQKEAFKAEMEDMLRKINAADTTGWVTRVNEFVSNTEMVFRENNEETDLMANIKPYLTLLLVLLIIPAINISAMIGGQMDRRMAEMGLRRSFGGSKSELCRQVMFENLILTIFGGLVGLVVAWIVLYSFKGTILGLVGNSWNYLGDIVEAEVTGEMLFAPAVFLGALLICIILNILSAYIPVKFALRRPIVSSINAKK